VCSVFERAAMSISLSSDRTATSAAVMQVERAVFQFVGGNTSAGHIAVADSTALEVCLSN